jgi:hypothetical protein
LGYDLIVRACNYGPFKNDKIGSPVQHRLMTNKSKNFIKKKKQNNFLLEEIEEDIMMNQKFPTVNINNFFFNYIDSTVKYIKGVNWKIK